MEGGFASFLQCIGFSPVAALGLAFGVWYFYSAYQSTIGVGRPVFSLLEEGNFWLALLIITVVLGLASLEVISLF